MNSIDRQVRFAVLCQGTTLPTWQIRVIRKLIDQTQIKLVLLITESLKEDQYLKASDRKEQSSSRWLWQCYHKHYVARKSKAIKTEEASELLTKVPEITYEQPGLEKKMEAIRENQLDFILHFGRGVLKGEILNSAKFGVWAFHHGDDLTFRSAAPGFWEIYHSKLVTASGLYRLTDDPNQNIVLKRGFLKTKITHPKNIDQVLFECAQWPLQSCIDILNDQLDKLEALPIKSDLPVISTPTNFQMISYVGRLIRLTAKKAFKSLFYTDFWNIGVAEVPIQRFLDTSSPPDVKWFPNLPKSKFIADPFGIKQGDKLHIVYEDFLFKDGVGTIGTLEYSQGGFSEERIEIDEPFHLSYPFTFEYENEVYAIPESYQAKQVRLYKALAFPHKWVFDRVLIDGYAGIDNTLLSHAGYWWMFSTDKDDGVHYNLKIHYAKDPFGQWHPHPKNPVKTDIRAARPAGSIFEHEGSIFRPSMDYSEKVEGRITLNKILTLSTTDFEEEAHGIINPFPNTFYSDKVHTLCAADNFTIVDGAKELFIFNNIHAFRYQVNKQWNKIARRMGLM